MASTSLEIVISGTDRFSPTANRVVNSLNHIGSSAKQIGKGVGELGAGLVRVGTIGAAALVGGLTAAAKTGIEFQDAFAGVRKTVEGTPKQLDDLYGSLRQLALRIPVQFTDLAGIAQEAGALGVARGDVVSFTDVVSRLSAATVGLSPEAAAEAFGKLGNVLHQHGADYERMGSVLVELGNAAASSEGDIIEVAKRFGAAGHMAGLSAAQVLGLSSAVSSLGVEPEAAGGALSRLFNRITTNIAVGNDKAKQLALTLHLGAAQLKKEWGSDALGVFENLLKTISGMDKFTAAKTLKGLGITNVRDVNALLLLAQNYGEVARQTNLATDAYAKNTALQDVSAKRFDTLKNKLVLFKNLILDAGVSVAEGFTPAVGRAVDKLAALITAHRGDLVQFGKDVGKFIDDIDWNKVADAATTFVDVLKTILSVVKQIPPEVDAAVAAFMGINKLSGGLIGKGVGDIIGGGLGLAGRGVAALLPGKLGSLVGALGAQPVFVTNWPMGGIGGGSGGGNPITGAAEDAAGGITIAGIASAVAGGLVAATPLLAAGIVYAVNGDPSTFKGRPAPKANALPAGVDIHNYGAHPSATSANADHPTTDKAEQAGSSANNDHSHGSTFSDPKALRTFNQILSKSSLTATDIKRLTSIEQNFANHGDVRTAAKLAAKLEAAKTGIEARERATAAAIQAKNWKPTVIVKPQITVRDVINGQLWTRRYGNVSSSAGPGK